MSYRPEGWINPISSNFEPYSSGQKWAFELGADVMLKALKQEGQYQTCIDQWDKEKPFTTGIGWLVFIPKEIK